MHVKVWEYSCKYNIYGSKKNYYFCK